MTVQKTPSPEAIAAYKKYVESYADCPLLRERVQSAARKGLPLTYGTFRR